MGDLVEKHDKYRNNSSLANKFVINSKCKPLYAFCYPDDSNHTKLN